MHYTKFIATPFGNSDLNMYIADILISVIDQVRDDHNDIELLDAILVTVQCIDHFIVLDNDQEIIKLCNQVGSFVLKMMDIYQDVFECICLHKDISYNVTPYLTGILVEFNEQ